MSRPALLLLLPLLLADVWAAPLTKYDQRQDGEFNVHAHLENFVILLIPGGGGGLLNIAAKIAPGAKHHGGKHVVKGAAEGGARHPAEEVAMALPVGLKSPPYKVDIDADRRVPIVLSITAPRVTSEEQHEVVIAESPAVTISKAQPPAQPQPQLETVTPNAAPEDPPAQPEPPMKAEEQGEAGDKPAKAADEPSEPSEKPQDVPSPAPAAAAPAKPEPQPSADKPIRKPAEAPAAPAATPAAAPAAASTAAADQKEAAAASEAERPAEPAKPAALAPAPAPAPAAEQAPASPPKQVAQEGRSRAARLELLRTGLVASPAGPCAPHEVRDGRCARALQPARVTKNFEDAVLLKALRFGLAPAN